MSEDDASSLMSEIYEIKSRLEEIRQNQVYENTAEVVKTLKDILKYLHQLPIDSEIVQETRVGKTVNDIRKRWSRLDEELKELSVSLIKKWQFLVISTRITRSNTNRQRKMEEIQQAEAKTGSSSSSSLPSIADCLVEKESLQKKGQDEDAGENSKCDEPEVKKPDEEIPVASLASSADSESSSVKMSEEEPSDLLGKLLQIKSNLDELLDQQTKIDVNSSSATIAVENAESCLKTLQSLPVDFRVLKESRVGITVNDIRKQWNNQGLQDRCKMLIKKWRKLLNNNVSTEETPSLTVEERKRKLEPEPQEQFPAPEEDTDESKSRGKGKKLKTMTPAETALVRTASMEDSVRMKCREMLRDALLKNEDLPEDVKPSLDDLVEKLELCIYEDAKAGIGFKYKSRINSRIANLKDPRNSELRTMFMSGEISAERLAKMSGEEMACKEMKALRAQIVREGITKSLLSTNAGTKTDLLKCGKCKGRNCVYNQLQTRSSDEPMTTFVLCNECGNRWKFN